MFLSTFFLLLAQTIHLLCMTRLFNVHTEISLANIYDTSTFAIESTWVQTFRFVTGSGS